MDVVAATSYLSLQSFLLTKQTPWADSQTPAQEIDKTIEYLVTSFKTQQNESLFFFYA